MQILRVIIRVDPRAYAVLTAKNFAAPLNHGLQQLRCSLIDCTQVTPEHGMDDREYLEENKRAIRCTIGVPDRTMDWYRRGQQRQSEDEKEPFEQRIARFVEELYARLVLVQR